MCMRGLRCVLYYSYTSNPRVLCRRYSCSHLQYHTVLCRYSTGMGFTCGGFTVQLVPASPGVPHPAARFETPAFGGWPIFFCCCWPPRRVACCSCRPLDFWVSWFYGVLGLRPLGFRAFGFCEVQSNPKPNTNSQQPLFPVPVPFTECHRARAVGFGCWLVFCSWPSAFGPGDSFDLCPLCSA